MVACNLEDRRGSDYDYTLTRTYTPLLPVSASRLSITASEHPSFCMLVFRTVFLKPETIANIPEKGYRAFQKASRQALLKLLHMKKKEPGYEQLRTKMSPGGEHKIVLHDGRYYLCDGFIAPTLEDDPHFMGTVIEVNGCHVHGHENCYPNREDLALNGKTHKENYEATLKKGQTLKRMGSLEIRDSFFGGHTEVFRVFAQKIPGFIIRYLDICSLYPFVNRSKSYPIGAPITISENFKEFRENEDVPYKGIIRCSIDPPNNLRFPVLPYRQNDRLFFTLCRKCSHMESKEKCEHSEEERRLHGTWTHFELNHAIAGGYKIHHAVEILHWDDWTSEEGRLFKDYIDTYLKVKQSQTASGYPSWVQTDDDKLKYIDDYFNAMGIRLDPSKISKNEGLRWIAKLALNSFWEKLGQRAILTQTEYVKDRADLWRLITTHGQRIVSMHMYGEFVCAVRFQLEDYAISTNPSSSASLAAITTSHARLVLLDFLEKVGANAIYSDTDSVIFYDPVNNPLLPTGSNLGDLTDELNGGEIVEIVCAGPKVYAFKWIDRDGKEHISMKIRGITLDSAALETFTIEPKLQANSFSQEDERVLGKRPLKRRRIFSESEDDEDPTRPVQPSSNSNVWLCKSRLTKRIVIDDEEEEEPEGEDTMSSGDDEDHDSDDSMGSLVDFINDHEGRRRGAMLKPIVLLAVLATISLAALPGQRYKLNIRRVPYRVRAGTTHHFKHDKYDYFLVTIFTALGSPFQPQEVTVDTVASDLEVNVCPNSSPDPKQGICFNTYRSSTYKKISDKLGSDTLLDADQKPIQNATFATTVKQDTFSGNLGLGMPDKNKYPGESSGLVYMSGDELIFSIAISPVGTFGEMGFGRSRCNEIPTTIYVSTSSDQHWQFELEGVKLGRVESFLKTQAVIDTKTEYIGMPKKFLDEFTHEYNITWDGLYGAYTIDCNKAANLPDLHFKIPEKHLVIRVEQYIYFDDPLPNDYCVVNFEDSKKYGFGPEWYFGTQIMTDYCVSFDLTRKRLGFTRN
ncbi:hypothetical protein QR680_003918 [Steinernema hermaphroditum]|uniref:DNA-directed DNA polymerase n=1 Tax=Steinernema hermaphroditum TaxID=289476 RepID=A0AA39LT67_9BILA|nr:hypothetical protein QR680_003918 [Steinernema hermaphroditum]